jgi:hypothetical protein
MVQGSKLDGSWIAGLLRQMHLGRVLVDDGTPFRYQTDLWTSVKSQKCGELLGEWLMEVIVQQGEVAQEVRL